MRNILNIVFGSTLFFLSLLAISPAQAANGVVYRSNEGKVLSVKDAAGYTYLEVDNNGKKMWVAGPVTKVKVGNVVRFDDAMTMTNFTSKALRRTFDSILFVGGIQVIK